MRSKRRNAWDVIYALMLREMATRYGRSWGGYAWAVIEPVAIIALLSIIFDYYFGNPPIGESIALFYATGLIPYLAFTEVMQYTGSALAQNKYLIYFPPVTALDTILARFALSCATLVVVSVIVFSGTIIYASYNLDLQLPELVNAMVATVVLGLGVGTANAVAFIFFPAWRNIWSILSRPLILISGVFFLFDSLPIGTQNFLWWNPLIHVIGAARKAFYPSYDGEYASLGYAYAIGIALFIAASALVIKFRGHIVESA